MKAILEFDLPEEQLDFQMASKAANLSCALSEIFNTVLRSRIKYEISQDELKLSHQEFLVKIRQEIVSILEEQGVEDVIL